ncbi:hypothetical protein GDO86_018504, partial [Hymenochirus boettgeri]
QAQKISLSKLLDSVEKANKNDTRDYTSGHLNSNNLFKPQTTKEMTFWRSGKKLKPQLLRHCQEKLSSNTSDAHVKIIQPPANVSVNNSSGSISSTIKSSNITSGPHTPINTPFTCSQTEGTCLEQKQGHKVYKSSFPSEESYPQDLKLWNFKYVSEQPSWQYEESYCSIPSYPSGLTKSDQFNMMLQFNKDILGKDDMTKDFYKNTLIEHFEKKLVKELQKIGDVKSPHLQRLQIFSKVFGDICKSSSIFGNILWEIKVS